MQFIRNFNTGLNDLAFYRRAYAQQQLTVVFGNERYGNRFKFVESMYEKVSKLVLLSCAFAPKDIQKRHRIDIYFFRFDISRQNTFICLNFCNSRLKN